MDIEEELRPLVEAKNQIANYMKPFILLSEAIDREYNVDDIEYNNAIKELHNKGYYLSILATPREYIEMNSYSNDQLEIMYLNLFEDKDGNLTTRTNALLEIMEDLVRPEWEITIKQSIKVIRDNGIDKSCMLVVPLYFCYLEFIIRDKLPLKGTETKKQKGKQQGVIAMLFSNIETFIKYNNNYSIKEQDFYIKLLASTKKTYYKYSKPDNFDIVSRNTIFHGFIGADKITKLDFYRQISLLSQIMYFFSMYDNTDKNIEHK